MAQNAQFAKWNIQINPGDTPPASLNLLHGALRFGLLLSPIEIYTTIVLVIFVLENYTWPLPRNDPEGMGGYTQPTCKKN